MKACGLGFALTVLSLAGFEPPPSAAQENPPGRAFVSGLGDTLHILEPVSIDYKGYGENTEDAKTIRVGDKALIRVTYDPAVMAVKDVEVRFGNKRMSACEVVRLPREAATDKRDTSETFAVVVRAVAASPDSSVVAVTSILADGTRKSLYFKFDVRPK